MPNYKIKLSEPDRRFVDFGLLVDGDVVTADKQPADGVTWSWFEAGRDAKPVAAAPVVPDSALPRVFRTAEDDAAISGAPVDMPPAPAEPAKATPVPVETPQQPAP
jgi:hypothetical protein